MKNHFWFLSLGLASVSISVSQAWAVPMPMPIRVGSFEVPENETTAGPAFPGHAYSFEVELKAGERLSFATMYGVSNDWFFSTTRGISAQDLKYNQALSKVGIFDAGTEVDQNPSNAPDTAGNQTAPNTGLADPVAYARGLSSFPSFQASNFIKVESRQIARDRYLVRLFVLAQSPTGLSPGVFWVTNAVNPAHLVFLSGSPIDPATGLERIAEDGNHLPLLEYLRGLTD
ncbi:MAG: hypothetical protein EOP09_03440 [Proteobacteria bacterium]|nr:MAG: hypothetical protein EOP09_03440 [Pseudomonadota bacterium]